MKTAYVLFTVMSTALAVSLTCNLIYDCFHPELWGNEFDDPRKLAVPILIFDMLAAYGVLDVIPKSPSSKLLIVQGAIVLTLFGALETGILVHLHEEFGHPERWGDINENPWPTGIAAVLFAFIIWRMVRGKRT